MSNNEADRLAEPEIQLDIFLSQFELDEQERILRYAFDHVVPRMKGRAALAKQQAPEATAEPTGPCLGCDLPNGCPEYCYCGEPPAALAAHGTQKAEATQAAENPTPCPWHSRYMPDCQFCRHAPPAQSPEQPSQAEPMSDETIERMVLNRPDMAQAIHFDIIPMGAFVDLGRAILAEAGIKEKP